MKNNRGQALVEFLLIIPILMFIVLAFIDVGNIVVSKYRLEDQISTIVNLYENNSLDDIQKFTNSNDLKVTYENKDNYVIITVSNYVSIITPGLNNILGKNMKIETKRTIYE